MSYGDDYEVVFNFGKYEGKRIMDVPSDYINWVNSHVKNQPILDPIRRIINRRGVTTLIAKISVPIFVPKFDEKIKNFTPIMRDSSLDPCLFGSFVEYLVKYHSGVKTFNEVEDLLSEDRSFTWIEKSYEKNKKTVGDICNLSFSHSILMDNFGKRKGAKLFKYANENADYFEAYLNSLDFPKCTDEEQETCDEICVGCVDGVIDIISGDSIIDIKCCQEDDLDYFRMQLFCYACLHYLRYGKVIEKCEVYNFLTGKHYTMNLGDSCERYAKILIRSLGSYCPEHVKLF
jgi:hypothetical protein